MSKIGLSLVVIAALAGAGAAEDKAEKAAKSDKPPTPLKVQVVYSRYQGEKKVSSMPYTLLVNADDRSAAVRIGLQVPVMVVLQDKSSTVMYKDVGNNLDCSAEALADGRFKLELSLEQGAVYSSDAVPKMPSEPAAFHAPVLRNFRSQTNMLLRDGQTGQYVAATDPITGETLKIEVTLNVVK